MTEEGKRLQDEEARREAITAHDKSILVEAGAGSGKTAIMAARVAYMLAEGVAPGKIAAVTFTELAAGELLLRIREFCERLRDGSVPVELRAAVPDGLSDSQKGRISEALENFDDITCATIHGFCQRLIKPYPVEANIDPGASVIDAQEADLVYDEKFEAWLRDTLSGDRGHLIGELVYRDPSAAVKLLQRISRHLRVHRALEAPGDEEDAQASADAFAASAGELAGFLRECPVRESETLEICGGFEKAARAAELAGDLSSPEGLVALLGFNPLEALFTTGGTLKKLRKKGKWEAQAASAGVTKESAAGSFDRAAELYEACGASWERMRESVATRILSGLVPAARPLLESYDKFKRESAVLDFDDLIFSARDLLRDNESVRRALSERHSHILVDEFQDTDAMQAEIFWRLACEPESAASGGDWRDFEIRPGALFLVGDPKQAIYRFRGADVGAYQDARKRFAAGSSNSVLEIFTNFRSRPQILDFVNKRFAEPLAAEGQPGFTALRPFSKRDSDGFRVSTWKFSVEAVDRVKLDTVRRAEAEAVSGLCASLIRHQEVTDKDTGEARPCRPGDIALLAPTGTDLWRLESHLEHWGIPVSTQVGKGFFRRQEVQDLIAVTRILANQRDTLALGAFLRGPLVGLSEEDLLDISLALPRDEEFPERIPGVRRMLDDPSAVSHPRAGEALGIVRRLAEKAYSTTPHSLLSEAVEALGVRAHLANRHGGQADRAIANVDLYLERSRLYAIRGLRAFSVDMTKAWEGRLPEVEGRPDALEDSVSLYSMHASKGLEWPIVIPVNSFTRLMPAKPDLVERSTGIYYDKIFGVEPTGLSEAFEHEKAELGHERVRLWYVAATRARERLILPMVDLDDSGRLAGNTWASIVDLSLEALPQLTLSPAPCPLELGGAEAASNDQTREVFEAQGRAISDGVRKIERVAPSLKEDSEEGDDDGASLIEDDEAPAFAPDVSVLGSKERGSVIHKLIEEALTGEVEETASALRERARDLIAQTGFEDFEDPAQGMSSGEISGSVLSALSLPEVAELRDRLEPELSVYASSVSRASGTERVVSGIADAVAFGPDGLPEAVIDWKSDVSPLPRVLDGYKSQVREYLKATGAGRGLIVLVTSGKVISVSLGG